MPVTQIDDKVWFDRERKLREICEEVRTLVAQGHNVIVLSHFSSSLSKLTGLLRDASFPHLNFSTYDSSQLCAAAAGTVWTGLARGFQAPSAIQIPVANLTKLSVIILEHHPRQSKDQELLDTAAKLSCQVELCFHFSLDDPLLRHFNGDSIKGLLKKVGIDESECLSHHLITAAIRNAQEKIESQVMRDLQAESIEDWFRYNLPETR